LGGGEGSRANAKAARKTGSELLFVKRAARLTAPVLPVRTGKGRVWKKKLREFIWNQNAEEGSSSFWGGKGGKKTDQKMLCLTRGRPPYSLIRFDDQKGKAKTELFDASIKKGGRSRSERGPKNDNWNITRSVK